MKSFRIKRTSLNTAIGLVLGAAILGPMTASAVTVMDGTYNMTIVANTITGYTLSGVDGAGTPHSPPAAVPPGQAAPLRR